jgi:hypothetical protein
MQQKIIKYMKKDIIEKLLTGAVIVVMVIGIGFALNVGYNRQEVVTCYKLQSQFANAASAYMAWEAENPHTANIDKEMCNSHGIDIHGTSTDEMVGE